MYTADDASLAFTDSYWFYSNWSYYENYETKVSRTFFAVNDYNDEEVINARLEKMTFTLYSIIFTLGITGNGLVIWIAGFRMKKTISAVWFLNLAIADFLCCASLPLRIAEWIYYFSDHVADTDDFCTTNIILFNLNVSSSVLLLVAMSIDRCVSVMWPFWVKVHRTRKLVIITAAIIWVMGVIYTGLVYYLYIIYVNEAKEWCLFYVGFKDHYNMYFQKLKIIQLIRLVIMFVIPFLIILISYVIIFIKLRKRKRSQRSQRPYRIIISVILGFFICWSPYYIWQQTSMYDRPSYDTQFYVVNIIVTILACVNSCINPIIYVFMGQDFKPGFLRSIPFRLERALSEHPTDLYKGRKDCACTDITEV